MSWLSFPIQSIETGGCWDPVVEGLRRELEDIAARRCNLPPSPMATEILDLVTQGRVFCLPFTSKPLLGLSWARQAGVRMDSVSAPGE